MSDCNSCPSNGKCSKDSCGIVINPLNKIKNVIGVMSGKGGVGKSTTTYLLAKSLNQLGFKVGVLDADITGPSIPRLFKQENEKAYATNSGIIPLETEDGIKTMSINFLLEEETQPVVWRGPVVSGAVKQFWEEVIWKELDYLLVDMPPGTGDVALTVMQSIPLNGVVVVSLAQEMVEMIVAKSINMAKKMNIPVIGIVENMSYIECPDCDKKIRIFDSNLQELAQEMGTKVLLELPMTKDKIKLENMTLDLAKYIQMNA